MGGGGIDTSGQQEQLRLQRESMEIQRRAAAADERRLAELRAAEDATAAARRRAGGRAALLNNELGLLDPPGAANSNGAAIPLVA